MTPSPQVASDGRRRAFPAGFTWGVATSAYQIEGAAREGGRGESIWDRFAAKAGAVADGSDGRVACDHYHRWREDVALLGALGIRAYRFSVAWPRVLPRGRGRANERGLDFYDALVDALLEAGVEPFALLHHWDLPQAMQDVGGWAARDTARAFAAYADAVARRLGDRVRRWATHNEPWCLAVLGHETGEHAPGHRDPAEALAVAHHLLLSHGWGAAALRAEARRPEVGIVLNLMPVHPASASEPDLEAARRLDGTANRWYLDALLRGAYPADVLSDHVREGHLRGPELPGCRDGDLAAIAAPLDFLGVNYYTRAVARGSPEAAPGAGEPAPGPPRTEMGWEVYPAGLEETLVRVHREYAPARLYVTENGAAYADAADASGRVADVRRREFLRAHVAAAHRALERGVPLAGYYVWSLLDNFEWAHGYTKRFGIVRVDFATQRRIPKESALWYRGVIRANAGADEGGAAATPG